MPSSKELEIDDKMHQAFIEGYSEGHTEGYLAGFRDGSLQTFTSGKLPEEVEKLAEPGEIQ